MAIGFLGDIQKGVKLKSAADQASERPKPAPAAGNNFLAAITQGVQLKPVQPSKPTHKTYNSSVLGGSFAHSRVQQMLSEAKEQETRMAQIRRAVAGSDSDTEYSSSSDSDEWDPDS
uniref:WH2 domain-containing protein n=1 Tax=Fibrocapsa japonica TaxID=94617 RepID=A0A7S2Y0L2_9STRA|mmetsp:Transcript_678/g.990  ORF Transcript_678/g.990 Transcript_678/m.990 type:complete len:117 (+) Transcript_678:1-351(+)